ncbi:hypothetical protein Trydic_g12993, partial [Trypoxylus dichotomus]
NSRPVSAPVFQRRSWTARSRDAYRIATVRRCASHSSHGSRSAISTDPSREFSAAFEVRKFYAEVSEKQKQKKRRLGKESPSLRLLFTELLLFFIRWRVEIFEVGVPSFPLLDSELLEK